MNQTGTGLRSSVGIITFNLNSNAIKLILLTPIVPGRNGRINNLFIYSKNTPESNLGDLMPELVH